MRSDTPGLGRDEAVADTPATASPATALTDVHVVEDDQFVAASSRRLEITVAVVAVVGTVGLLFAAQGIELRREADPGQIDARFWPTILAVLGIVLAVARLITTLLRPADERTDLELTQTRGWWGLALSSLLTVAYVLLWSLRTISLPLGGYIVDFPIFVVITPLFLVGLLFIFGGRGWKTLIIFPVVTTAFIYFLFGELLRIAL